MGVKHPNGTATDHSGGEEGGSDVTPQKILEYLDSNVARWWLPDEILFVDSLPHTATGKLLKTALREQYRDYRLGSVEVA